MSAIQQSLSVILEDLKNIANIEASVIASHQGLVMVADVPEYVPEAKLGAFTATILESAKTVMEELRQKPPNMLMIRSSESIIIFMEAGDKAILGTLFQDEQNIGLIIVEMEDACKKISQILN
jgi:predicted regulator of Ras-like GTPase activity (Roadblock/LC7/MglB family)